MEKGDKLKETLYVNIKSFAQQSLSTGFRLGVLGCLLPVFASVALT